VPNNASTCMPARCTVLRVGKPATVHRPVSANAGRGPPSQRPPRKLKLWRGPTLPRQVAMSCKNPFPPRFSCPCTVSSRERFRYAFKTSSKTQQYTPVARLLSTSTIWWLIHLHSTVPVLCTACTIHPPSTSRALASLSPLPPLHPLDSPS